MELLFLVDADGREILNLGNYIQVYSDREEEEDMKTLLINIKTALTAARTVGALDYVPAQGIQKVAPKSLPPLRNDQFPFVGIAPVSSPETWSSSHKREVTHTVELYCARSYEIQEDAVDKSAELVENVLSVVRNNKFDSYLSAPCQPSVTGYITTPYGDNIYLIVATISLECRKLFLSS